MAAYASEFLVEIHNLYFYRGNRAIFSGVDFNIPKGKITAIMGPSGIGKTTLLRLIAGQIRPHQGEIYVAGKNIHQFNKKECYQYRKGLGMLFQSGALFTDLNVFENVAFPLREHTKLSESMIRSVVLMKLESVGLRGAAYLPVHALSGGMARRVALARAVVLDPMIILYDEPFTGQDPISMGVLLKLIRDLNRALGITSILVSHDVVETAAIADYLYLIVDGKIVAEGEPEVLKHADSPWVRQFMAGEADGPVPFHYPAKNLVYDLLLDNKI